MHLHATPRSPFARRIRACLQRHSVPHTEMLYESLFPPPEVLLRSNPLGQVPCLDVAGMSLTDSHNILEYLHDNVCQVWSSNPEIRARERQNAVLLAAGQMCLVREYLGVHVRDPLSEYKEDNFAVLKKILTQIASNPDFQTWNKLNLTQPQVDLHILLNYADVRFSQFNWREIVPFGDAFLKDTETLPWLLNTRPIALVVAK